MKCPNSFVCAICQNEYHRMTPPSQQWEEHEHRKETIAGYADTERTVEVCDPCFQIVSRGFLPKKAENE